MKFFKNLLQFLSKEELEQQKEYRRSERYDVSSKLPLKAYLIKEEKKVSVSLLDVSLYGIGCEETSELEIAADDMIKLSIELDDVAIMLMSRVVYKANGRLGMDVFTELESNYDGYLQILTPISVGATLKEYDVNKINQSDEGYTKHIFFGAQNSSLTLWTTKGKLQNTDDIKMYEFNMDNFIMRIENHKFTYTFLDNSRVFSLKKHHKSEVFKEEVDVDLETESKKLFSMIILSAKDNLPGSLKEYLLQTIR
jgi:hypothetical protein